MFPPDVKPIPPRDAREANQRKLTAAACRLLANLVEAGVRGEHLTVPFRSTYSEAFGGEGVTFVIEVSRWDGTRQAPDG